MKNALEKFVNEYPKAKNEIFAGNPFGNFVRKDLPDKIYQAVNLDKTKYLITASVGQGNWAMIPWICIFDKSITTTATKGVYIVYLLSKDCSKLYLTFNQGCTDIRKNHSRNETIKIMRNNAEEVSKKIDSRGFKTDQAISLGEGLTELGIFYEKGTIFYTAYDRNNFPSEDILKEDLLKMLEIYSDFTKKNDQDEWWPSLDEYTPGISKDKWGELLNNPEIFGPIWSGALAMFYEQGGAATCSQLGKIYNRDPAGIAGNCTQMAMHIYKKTNCRLLIQESKKRYWPILFVGRKATVEESGVWVWKLRKELYDAISESDILKYLPKKGRKSWLITWNPAYYPYSEYEEKRNGLLSGEKYIDQWACANTHVEIGDRVYLMRVGTKNNGIIASGYAASTGYMSPHYDPEIAKTGKMVNKIDVDFDFLVDRNGDKYLDQGTLDNLFPEQKWNPQSSGIEIKAQYCESLEQEWQKYINTEEGGEEEMIIDTKKAISKIKSYIAAKGYTYNDGLIENFYLSLKSKPFVILAGTSGTGKTRLVKLFAEAIGAEYKMVAVRPDWSDSSDLFGHVDLNGNYIPGVILDYISEANNNPKKPYILCLDEMNLARVEYYLSDFLSVIETRDFVEGEIISDPLVSAEKYGEDDVAREKYGQIGFPQNLYLVGTVNMDETTFPFSKKVLDRANTIEFNYVDLLPEENEYEESEQQHLPNSFLASKYLLLAQCNEDKEFVREISAELQKLNVILQKANLHVGYRIRDEIVFYMLNNKETELLSQEEALDNEIMQKILPRIQGSSVSVKEMLCELFKVFAGDYQGQSVNSEDLVENMLSKIKKEGARYPKSAEKTAFMVRRFEEDGFTSYWL